MHVYIEIEIERERERFLSPWMCFCLRDSVLNLVDCETWLSQADRLARLGLAAQVAPGRQPDRYLGYIIVYTSRFVRVITVQGPC